MFLDPHSLFGGLLMVGVILGGFTAMTIRGVPQALALALVSVICLTMQGGHAETVLRTGFSHFSDIVVLFTGVAIPAHQIERSGAFRRLLGHTGDRLGNFAFRHPKAVIPVLATFLLAVTYVLAALGHNTTSILIMTPFAIHLCSPFRIPTRYVLSGMLIASNLGGFSTRWGDTPNIIQSRVWGLNSQSFLCEIMPWNLVVLGVLCSVVAFLTHRLALKKNEGVSTLSDARLAEVTAGIKDYFGNGYLDRRLLAVGAICLTGFIALQIIYPAYQIAFGAITIAVAVLADHPHHRLQTLQSLGFETYTVFASIFVLAGCVENSWIGHSLHQLVETTHAAPWVVALTAYFGTTSTEAASWATAAASTIQPIDPSHRAAWALGAGICAGSSSIITAASAGIILASESKRAAGGAHEVTFGKYLPFGLGFSLFMLVFYSIVLSILRF